MHRQSLLTVSAVLCITASSAWAGLNQSVITAPGGFVQTGASGSSPGSSLTAGADLFGFLPAGADLHEQSFSGNAQATNSAAYSIASVNNSASGMVGLGMIKLSASNTAPNGSAFAMSAANGGWNETMTVNDPALTGQQGFAQVKVQVLGTLNASGFAGSSQFWLTGYKNHAQLDIYGGAAPYVNSGHSDAISTDRQQFAWSVATYAVGTSDSRNINDMVTFAVPITFGQPFTLGIYGYAAAGMRSSSGVPGTSSSSLDFSHSLYWSGISNVIYNGTPVPSYTLSSASGINWVNPIPEPASVALLLLSPILFLRRPGRDLHASA